MAHVPPWTTRALIETSVGTRDLAWAYRRYAEYNQDLPGGVTEVPRDWAPRLSRPGAEWTYLRGWWAEMVRGAGTGWFGRVVAMGRGSARGTTT